MKVTNQDGPDSNESKEYASKDGTLPKTATNMFHMILLGGLLAVLGTGSFVFFRRSRKRSWVIMKISTGYKIQSF